MLTSQLAQIFNDIDFISFSLLSYKKGRGKDTSKL